MSNKGLMSSLDEVSSLDGMMTLISTVKLQGQEKTRRRNIENLSYKWNCRFIIICELGGNF